MKALNALLIATLLGASVSAMAEDGSDHVTQQMDTSSAVAMAHYQQDHMKAVVSNQKAQTQNKHS